MSMDTQYGPPVDSQAVDPSVQVDPNSPPADPMLDLSAHDEPQNPMVAGEASTRDRVELAVLLAIETMAKACQAGEGASNMDYAVKAAQSAAAFGQTYMSLAGIELKEAQGQVSSLQQQLSFGDPSQQA